MAATGALAVIFGEGQVYRRRWRVIGAAAIGLAVSAFAGGLTGELIQQCSADGGSHWWQLLLVGLMTAVAVAGTYIYSALRLGPPGGFFFVLAAGVGALITGHGVPPDQVALWTAIGGVSALLIGMSAALARGPAPEERAVSAAVTAVRDYAAHDDDGGDRVNARYATALKVQTAWALLADARRPAGDDAAERLTAAQRAFADTLRRRAGEDDESGLLFDTGRPAPTPRPALRYRILRSLSPDSHAAVSANRIGIAALLAGCLAVALDLGRPDWAVLTVTVLLHQGPDRVRGTYRGVHRVGGTVLGLVLFAALYAVEPRSWALVLILMALQFAIELFVARNYGIAVVFITPLALLIGGGGKYGEVLPVVRDRLVESLIGVLIGLATLWAVDRRAHRRVLLRNDQRVTEVLDRLLRTMALPPQQRGALAGLRRELEFELMGSTLGAIDAAHNEPEWTRAHWTRHQRIRRLGHRVLAASWWLPRDAPCDRDAVDRWARSLAELA